MHLKVSLHLSKKTILITLGILSLIGAGVAFYILQSSKNPLPSDIKQHVSFKIIYPTHNSAKVETNSFVYQAKQKVLTFNVEFAGTKVA
jgi:hypothetical protein